MDGLPWQITILSLFLVLGALFQPGNPHRREKTKRFQLPFNSDSMSSPWNGGLSQELQFTQTQMPDGENTLSLSPNSMTSTDTNFNGQNQFMSFTPMQPNNQNEMLDDATNRDQLGSNSLSFLQGQYNSPNQQSPEKVEYFEPNETGSPETPPYLDSTFADTGPSKDDLKKIQPLLESENDITNAIIKDTWKQDNALTSSRQAVSEGLTTAHQLANTDWKNKPIVHEKPQQQANNKNNFLLDEARPVGMHKQESLIYPVVQEKRPQKDNNNNGEDYNNSFLDQALPVGMRDHESPRKPMIKEKNNTSSFLKTDELAISSLVNSTRVHDKSLASSSSNSSSSVLQNKLIKKKVSESHSGSTNEWFTNATLAKSKNISLENVTEESPKNDQLSKKLYTAADYLKSLYPQLSVFKAPLEKIKNNASLPSSTLSSLLHDKVTLRKLISLAPTLDIKDVHGQRKNEVLGLNKISTEEQRKAQQELLKSLMKVNFMLGERSAIKQDQNSPGHSALSKLLLMRSTKPVNVEPVHAGYLTESGAKLLPAHIFSPLGSEFKDSLEHSSTPAARTSPTTSPTTTDASQTKASARPILPSQAGQIPSQTQSHAGKEPSTVVVIVPTQSGMITTASSNSEKNQGETMIKPTVRDSEVSSTSETFIHPTMPTTLVSTKNPFVPTQSGFIPGQTSPVKITLPTAAPFLPTQIGFIPSRKQKDNIWTGPAEDNSEIKNRKTNTRKQRFFSHETSRAKKTQPKSELSHFPRKPNKWSKTLRNSGPYLLNSRVADSLPAHFRERRQMFVPVPLMQTNNNPQEFAGQALLPGQLDGQLLLPNLPQLPQLQQPIQQFLPTQPLQGFAPQLVQSPQAMGPMSLLGQPDARSQFPFQQPMNPIPQTLFSPQQNQYPGFPFGTAPGQLNQLSSSIGVTPIQHILPEQNSQLGYRQNDVRSIGAASLSPITVNIPMTAPRKIPSFLTASQVYKDFEDVNSRSHLSDDIFGGQISRGDVSRNDFGLEGDSELPEEPKYDKFAYENDKKMWGIDNDYSEDDGANTYRAEPRKHRKAHYASDDINDESIAEPGDLNEGQSLTNLRYSTGRRRFHRPGIHHRHHWVNENDLTRVNGKEIIGHNEGENEELNDDGFHVADETTENASKEDSFEAPPKAHHSSKKHQASLDDSSFETDQSEKSSANDVRESDQSSESAKTGQSELRESVETESETESDPQSDQSEDSSQGTQEGTPSDDKSEKHDELKDGLEESTTEESTSVTSLPKPVSGPSSATLREELIKKLSHSAVMHLNFDAVPHKPGDKTVQDESGNKNDAGLANGAEISNRTMGSCGRVAILKHGEVMYKAAHFTRKPEKAASIAMWVKSRKPGFVRWFDVGDDAEAPATGSRTKKSDGKLVKVPKNQWIHLAGTFDSKDGIARVYVNGKLISETVGRKNKGLPDDFTATGIGEKFGDKFISFLDDIYMFDRVITPAEVKVLYKKCEFNRMVLHFGFQNVNTTTHQVMDQSGLENNATIDSGAHIMNSGCDKCGACLDASNDNMPGVYLDGKKFHHKPVSAISIASWISLNKTKGRHSIFQAVSNKNDEWHDIYNVDVINGKLHWRHKNTNSDVVFDVKTEDVVIPEGLWSHVTATYSSESGDAKIYVNGLLKATVNNANKPKLNAAWGRMSIGGHLPDAKNFAGLLDEFFIYNWALDPSEVRFVLKYCADKPKLVSFTVRVPLFKRQRVQTASQVPQALNYL